MKPNLPFKHALTAIALAAAFSGNAQIALAQDAGYEATTGPVKQTTFADMMSGKNFPLRLQFKNLTPAFRRVVVGGSGDYAAAIMGVMAMQKGLETNVFYTKGYTVSIGGETYLVAYRPQIDIDPAIFQHHGHGARVERRKPSPNTVLALSLLNLRTSGSLNDVRPFDPKQDMQTPQEGLAASVRQLTNLGQGVLTYVRGRGNGLFPTVGATVTPALQRAFYPFVHDRNLWNNPANDEPYRVNTALSGKRLSSIINGRFIPMFYEGTLAADGTRAVLFIDGHVERLNEERFTRVRNAAITMKPAASAATIRAKVRAALAANTALKGSTIDVLVSVANQTITLSGTVRDSGQMYRAPRTARQAAPEFRINNNLRVAGAATRPAAARRAR